VEGFLGGGWKAQGVFCFSNKKHDVFPSFDPEKSGFENVNLKSICRVCESPRKEKMALRRAAAQGVCYIFLKEKARFDIETGFFF
jgi:hypothetical protein